MSWTFNPFTFQFDYYQGDTVTIEEHSTDTTLTADDLKKVHVMDVVGGERNFYLPSISTGYKGYWITLVRKQAAGSLMRVWANGSDVIFNTGAGGYLECADTNHDYCGVNLIVIDDGVWGNQTFGVWSSYPAP